MGVQIKYKSEDGFFHMKAPNGLNGVTYTFKKPTHTGTETLIMSSVLGKGKTVLRNCAKEPEIDELVDLLNKMGAKIEKKEQGVIEITGVHKLKGTRFRIGPDRNEVVTIAIAAILTKGDITVKNISEEGVKEFLVKMKEIGAGVEILKNQIRFFYKGNLKATDMQTGPYPGFMTDWQAPWTVLMTQAKGESLVHETVYESRFGYVTELQKMGADIELFNPVVENPEDFYNFNVADDNKNNKHAARIKGPTLLHNAVVKISDLRAGATLVLAALAASGESVILEVHHLDRGYESFEKRLSKLGADIKRITDE
jgi:UDP-N-acetylglucosamine 1-carboxyvinyltransferase